ncbi:MAG: cytochrome oxidase biogenesis protein Surf1, facilitates heme A insertion [Roseovarius sp. BRH_c41]|jgi:surfeit locus 1 family protein|uniref:SURF1 family protein n=1 Tax=Roseovarius sp. BRH_c41 TaxID=1629709 RepID=UPI0005F14A6D|nr:SURF1 family protein [Roseovarius sp. BRH_c41]KJS45764.1 MAG: cytochrome oxidase biogenesis protein Surf1, facilitates heme A insertion [Roseovarius sp. BRH_c41]
MRKSILIPLTFGIAGVAVLIGLGKWQVDRLAWKEGVLADIEAHIAAPPVELPEAADPTEDRYLPVAVAGQIGDAALRVLVSQKQIGAGYRVISALETDGRRVLLDRGFIKVSADIPTPPEGEINVSGNLHWPDERLSSTPENDVPGNIWFARDIAQMAEVLETEPVLIVARALSVPEVGVSPLPVDTSGIPNDHLSYAITWFSLAAIWAAMTGVFIWRMRQTEKGKT